MHVHRTYLVSAPIIPYYYTQLIGDAKNPPTLLAALTFNGMAVIGTPFWAQRDIAYWSIEQMLIHTSRVEEARNIFKPQIICRSKFVYFQPSPTLFICCSHRSIRNFVIDTRQYDVLDFLTSYVFLYWTFLDRVPPQNSQGTGIHWQVAQATSLMNIVFEMSAASNTAHQGK